MALLVTKTAILLINYAVTLRERNGMERNETLLKAGPLGLRPNLMTTATITYLGTWCRGLPASAHGSRCHWRLAHFDLAQIGLGAGRPHSRDDFTRLINREKIPVRVVKRGQLSNGVKGPL